MERTYFFLSAGQTDQLMQIEIEEQMWKLLSSRQLLQEIAACFSHMKV
jgi:BarA-like signal transduction histidine kinase